LGKVEVEQNRIWAQKMSDTKKSGPKRLGKKQVGQNRSRAKQNFGEIEVSKAEIRQNISQDKQPKLHF
jgi:hypothetical protein